ncbi:hypothetical protein GGF42_006111 [Coemansia sp. RSA 2424]|nr:hypothetical protein GGF42_006111 [Coemansia sp. RSA 2424]
MSDYNVLSQLFRLNPDSPQAHMLSNQELQDDLALWGSVQFQLEPVGDEPLHSHDKNIKGLASATPQNGVATVSAAESASAAAWSSFMGMHSQEPLSPQGNPLDFMMGGATTADLLSALAAAPITPQQWAHFAQQPPNTPAYANSAHIAPLAPQALPQTLGEAAPAPSTSMFRYPTLIPKVIPPGATTAPVVTASTTTNTSAPRRGSAKAKQATPPAPAPVAAPLDDTAEDSKLDFDDDCYDLEETGDGRQQAASDDKRRRNTAASARFRVKKKLKEQALERTAREMTVKAEALERRVQELEMETRWLKSLIIDKDPNILSNIRCPCHHPNGLDLSSVSASVAHHSLGHPYHSNLQPAHQYIAPAPTSALAGEPPLKRSKA